ncbi:MAG: XrtB/PEP-CTERM-associated polysaccharide biosynthesis outer membrane protein EpsL [Pseudomonadota bacterium]
MLLGGALLCGAAWAGPNDALHPFVGLSYHYDDNLLRIADDSPGFIGPRSDTARRALAGVLFDKTYSRQKVYLLGKLSKVSFERFKRLDHDDKDFQARLDWQIGNHLEGKASATYSQGLAPYADFRTTERNLREIERQAVEGAWRFHPSWRARAGASREQYTYELARLRVNNRESDTVELGGDYLAASGSTVGFQLRRIDARYPNGRAIGQIVFDDSFEQTEFKARVVWRYSEKTELSFLGGRVERKHARFGERDTSGTNARADLNWSPRAALRLTGSAWREFAAVESVLANASLSKGVSVDAVWAYSAKLKIDAQLRREKRDFRGLVVGLEGGALNDTSRYASVGAAWTPTQGSTVRLSAFRDARSGSPVFGNGDYRANGVSLSASIQF